MNGADALAKRMPKSALASNDIQTMPRDELRYKSGLTPDCRIPEGPSGLAKDTAPPNGNAGRGLLNARLCRFTELVAYT
jgi:hypothetical protein